MPIRARKRRDRAHRITPAAIAAFRAGDYHALHDALALAPWEASPLPESIEILGVDSDCPPTWSNSYAESWRKAVELQRELRLADS